MKKKTKPGVIATAGKAVEPAGTVSVKMSQLLLEIANDRHFRVKSDVIRELREIAAQLRVRGR